MPDEKLALSAAYEEVRRARAALLGARALLKLVDSDYVYGLDLCARIAGAEETCDDILGYLAKCK